MYVNNNDSKKALDDMGKKAQENARNFVSVMTPTSIAYSAPWYQWQKVAQFLLEMASHPNTNLEKMAAPYAKELVQQLINLKIVVLTKEACALYPNLKSKINLNNPFLYTNHKGIKLSMFAKNNPFSGINKPNEFGAAINYNGVLSISAGAQGLRHRTAYWEFEEMEKYCFVTPPYIEKSVYKEEHKKDMNKVKGLYPQGQMLRFNIVSSLKNIIYFMGQERACERAQQEIENWYVNRFLLDIIEGLEKKEAYQEECLLLKREYKNKCRCAYPTYTCPKPCGHPRTTRPF